MSGLGTLFGGGSSAPQVPDPSIMAAQQLAANEDVARTNARLNRINTYTPYGSVLYEDLGDDQWKATQTLSPGMQGLLDQTVDIGTGVNEAAQSRLGNLSDAPFTLEGIPEYQTDIDRSGLMVLPTADSLNDYAQRAEDAAYNRVAGRLDDRFLRDEEQLMTDLANRGLTMGSEAYNRALQDFRESKGDAYTQAGYQAVQQGSALRSSLLADALTGRQQGLSEQYTDLDVQNQGRQQAINDRILGRTQELNELAALLQGQQAISSPQPVGGAGVRVAPPDIGGAYGLSQSAQNAAYQADQARGNAAMGGLFGLGAAALSAFA